MLRNDKNRIQMFATVMATLEKNESHWEKIESLAESVGIFEALNDAIQDAVSKQLTPTAGHAQSKESLRTQLEDELMDVADALGAFAHKTKNYDLAAQVDYTPSGLSVMDSVRALDFAKRILAKGQAEAAVLPKFGLGPKDLEQLEGVIAAFEEVVTKPREAIGDRAAQTKALPALVRTATKQLRGDLDKQMNLFRRRQPVFFAAYRNARIIVDSGMNTGSRTNEPVKDAEVPALPA